MDDAARALLLIAQRGRGPGDTFTAAALACYEMGDAREQQSRDACGPKRDVSHHAIADRKTPVTSSPSWVSEATKVAIAAPRDGDR